MAFFKHSKELTAVSNGKLISLENVKDPVFSAKLMGEGFAIENPSEEVYSPCDGVISDIFPTKHAITIENKNGDSILVHIGLDTVELNGVPFTIHVNKGDKVSTTTLIATVDLDQLAEAGKDSTIVVVVPELQKGELLKEAQQSVLASEKVFKF